ncbi:MAG TPA: GyrI-like domain-containing protein [Cyclobacteriaceae bacterium]|nr:GyrI-like domain-containing protein [Cyclobacteriaceae bacterium]
MMTITKATDTQPSIKEVMPINFLYYRTETTVDQLLNFIPVTMELFREAVNYNLHVTGPIHWHYFGFNGDASVPFTLEISLPVSEVIAEYDGNFHFKRTETFRCVALTHEGGWDSLPESYGKIMQFLAEEHLEPIGVTREIYINADFKDPGANVTWVQIGIRK